jgi:membrane protein
MTTLRTHLSPWRKSFHVRAEGRPDADARVSRGIPAGEFIQGLVRRVRSHAVTGAGAELAYYFMLALFPFLLFLVSLMPYLPLQPLVDQAVARLSAVMPSPALDLIQARLSDLLHRPRPHLLTVSVAASLWTASRGVDALRHALNVAYEVPERRPYWRTQGSALLVTLGGAALFLAGFLMIALGGRGGLWLANLIHLNHLYLAVWSWLRWPLTGWVVMLAAALTYHWLPDAKVRFRYLSAGSVSATLIWISATWALTVYSAHFGNYGAAYGSLAGFAFLMVWLYVSGIALVLGGEINALLDRLRLGDAPATSVSAR